MRNLTIQLPKKTFLAEPNPSGTVGRTFQRSIGGTGKGAGMPGSCRLMLAIGFSECRCQRLFCLRIGVQRPWCKNVAKDVGKCLAFSGPMGCCGLAHDNLRLECSGEVRAAWRALLLPHWEGAPRSYKRRGTEALCSCGTLRECALTCLHLMAAKSASAPSGSQKNSSLGQRRCAVD